MSGGWDVLGGSMGCGATVGIGVGAVGCVGVVGVGCIVGSR